MTLSRPRSLPTALLLCACAHWAAVLAEESADPLAVLDKPAPAAAAGTSTNDPLSVLEEPSPTAPDGDVDMQLLQDIDPEAAKAARRAELLKPPPPVSTLEAARRLYEQGELAQADIAVRVLLRENRFDQAALMLRADLQLARYDGAGAEMTLRRALDARVPQARVLVKLARALNLQREYRSVLDELQPDGLDDPTERARLLAEQARAHVGLGHIAEAQLLLDEALAIGPDAAAPYIGRAVLALRDGFPDQARELADRALQQEPDNGDAWLLLGDIERTRGNRAAAEVAFGQAISRAPSKWMAAYWRALTRTELGKLDGAARDIELAAAQFPTFVGLSYARGRLLLAQHRPREASLAIERYLGSMPGDGDALFHAALAANQLRNRQQALEYLDRLAGVEGASTRQLWLRAQTHMAAGDHGKAAGLLADAAGPEAPAELILARHEALLRLHRRDEALALIEQARQAQPSSRGLAVAEAKLRFAAGDREAAEAIARALMDKDPSDVDALLILGEAALLRGEAGLTLAVQLRHAATRAPREIRLPTLRAEVLAANDAPGEACAALVDALRIDPGADGVLRRMQRLRCASVEPELVQQAYREVLATHPDAGRALPGLLALSADAEDAEAGVERLAAALAAAPEDIALRSALVDARLRLRRPDAAWEAVEAAPDHQASHPLLLRARGVVALTRGADRIALAAFKDLAGAQPESAEAAYLLAEAEARVGDARRACYHLLEAWRRAPEHPLAAPVVARVFAADRDPQVRRRLIDDLRRSAPDAPLIEPLHAQTLLDAGHADQAAEVYAAMHQRDPNNPRLFLRLVRSMVAAGQREPVIALAEPWMARHPEHVDIALALADVHADLGHAEPAARWYRRVLGLDPDNLFALNDLAVLLTESAPATAVLLAERAHALAPDHPQVMDTYGAALLATGDAAQARKLLREAYGYRGMDPGIGLNLARALAADGDPDAARRVLQPLIDDDFPRQAEARALLQRLSAHERP